MLQQSGALEDIFLAALERDSAEERRAYLDTACAGDAALRERIEALLHAHAAAGSFLEKPPEPPAPPKGEAAAATGRTTQGAGEVTAPPDAPAPFGEFGAYRVTGIIGQGGMGMVFRGHEARLNRTVAIKVLNPALASVPAARERFVREARVAAAIRHEHVITIHAIDEAHGMPYLVMEHVQGESLQQRLDRDGPLPVEDVVRIAEQVAAGLAAAHAQGLIHRDIKPANLLVEAGTGRVKIADFGLARPAEEGGITLSGVVAGSPQYMSPEQAHGKRADERSDLFSLGCLLYALCVGHSPFRADSVPACLERVRNAAVTPVTRLNPAVPAWLGHLIGRLLEKEPARRVQSAREVIEALRERAAPPAERGRRRRRAVAGALVLTVAAVLAALLVYPWWRNPDDDAERNAGANVSNPPAPSAPPEKPPATPVPPPPPEPVADSHEIRRLTGKGQMRTMALSPDEKTVYAGGYSGKIHVWDLERGTELRTIPLDGSVSKLRMSRDGTRLAVTSPFTLYVYDPHTGAQLVKRMLCASIHDMAFLPDQRHLLCVFFGAGTAVKNRKVGAEFDYQGLNVIDTVTGKLARTVRLDEPHFFRSVACSPDGQWFAAGSDDGSAFVVNAAEGKQTHAFKLTFGACFAVRFSRDSRRLFASDNGSHLRAWRVSDGQMVSAGTFPHLFTRFYLSPDETWLALNDARECDLYDLTRRFGQVAGPLPRHESKIADVAFLSNGEQILTCSWDGTVRLWRLPPRVKENSLEPRGQ